MSKERPRVSLVVPRLDEKPWGGRKLATYGLDLPPNAPIGEALVTAGEAAITGGVGAGGAIQDVIAAAPDAALGARARAAVGGRALFPLLVKLIDAAENLSIQVHPDDKGARDRDRLGKTEAWYVLDAEPGSTLYLGLAEGADFGDFMTLAKRLDGSSERALRVVPAEVGRSILIPSGTVHALGAGVMVYEIQQPSDVTFRLDDWGRVDKDGNPREMHLAEGETAARPHLRPDWIEPVDVSADGVRRHLLAACRSFALEHIALEAGQAVRVGDEGSPHVLTVLTGHGEISGGDDPLRIGAGASAVAWPDGAPAVLTAATPMVVLRGWVPDIARDVVAVARAAGATNVAISALGGDTADIATEAGS